MSTVISGLDFAPERFGTELDYNRIVDGKI